jgi:phosphohistidine swiveling domain-containing protein
MEKEYFKKHLSLSEWIIQSNISNGDSMIVEDSTKRKRLSSLNDLIGLPIVKNSTFLYNDIIAPSESFAAFLENAGDHNYALRAASMTNKTLPVLRNRKLKVNELINWLKTQDINFDDYKYDFELHIDPQIATIFIVEDNRVIGECATGSLLQLNKGVHDDTKSIYFEYDFRNWRMSEHIDNIINFLQESLELIRLRNEDKQALLDNGFIDSLNTSYLRGYFEVINSDDSGTVFVDFNRLLKDNLTGIELFKNDTLTNNALIKGNIGCSGKVVGKAKVILDHEVGDNVVNNDEILVCHFTSPDFLPLITASIGVITDIGGILSHAAIVCRELKKPCLIGTKVATQRIKTGDFIEVNAFDGYVRFL